VDLGLVAGIVMLVVWAIAALVMDGPGWVHLLLTVGVFLIIYRIVARGTPDAPKEVKVQPPGRAKGKSR